MPAVCFIVDPYEIKRLPTAYQHYKKYKSVMDLIVKTGDINMYNNINEWDRMTAFKSA